jgi:hypothetical protein
MKTAPLSLWPSFWATSITGFLFAMDAKALYSQSNQGSAIRWIAAITCAGRPPWQPPVAPFFSSACWFCDLHTSRTSRRRQNAWARLRKLHAFAFELDRLLN